jgi:outer membrane receptor protein involved in Fe transport
MGKIRIPAALVAGLSLVPAAAGEPLEAPKPKVEAAATVTVTAEASPVPLIKTPNPVRILDKAAIEQSGARTLGDLLESLFPGQILANGGVGTASSLFLGGARNQDVVVTLDGIRITDASGLGGLNANALGLAGIDRVEVQLGPCTSRFGSDAMGGAVALHSSGSAAPGLSGDLRLGLGTQGIRQGGLSAAYGWNGGWLRTGLQASQEEQATPTPNPFRSTGVFLGAGQAVGEDTLVTLTYRNTNMAVPIPYSGKTYLESREDGARSEQLIATVRMAMGPRWLGELTLGQALQTRLEPNYGDPGSSPYDSRRNQALGHLAWTPAEGLGLNLSVDAYEEFAGSPGYPSGTDRGAGRHLGADLEASWEPLPWLRLLGDLRQQWDHQNFVFRPGTAAVPDTRSSQSTWKLGANALLGAGFRLYAAGGSGFSLPILSAVMYNATNFASTALNPERSSFLRAGAGWQRGPWSARLEASRTSFSELVYFDLGSYVYANGSRMRLQGLEGSLAYQQDRWGAEGSWRNQEARDLDAPAGAQLSSPAVLRRPFNILGARTWRQEGPWRIEARWSWSGSRYENFGGYPARIAASRTHFNDLALGLTWAASRSLSFSLRGEHLLQPRISVADWVSQRLAGRNDAYQIYGFPAQPPTAALELRYRF